VWKPISAAPYECDLRLTVLGVDGEYHALVFPCCRVVGGWVNSGTRKRVDRFPQRPRTSHYTRPNRGKSRLFGGDGELGVSAGLRGGAGRTRTCNQPVMSGLLQSPAAGDFLMRPAQSTKKHWEPSSPAIMGRRYLIPRCLSPKSALSSNLANTDCRALRVVLPAVELCEKLPELMLKVRAAPVGSGILTQDALDLPYSV
jgi:hypothetical protein